MMEVSRPGGLWRSDTTVGLAVSTRLHVGPEARTQAVGLARQAALTTEPPH